MCDTVGQTNSFFFVTSFVNQPGEAVRVASLALRYLWTAPYEHYLGDMTIQTISH